MSMYGRDYIMKLMQLPGQIGNLRQQDAEELFSEFATKLMAGENLSDDEKKYMDTYMKEYYPVFIGGRLYPYPKYDEKLKPIYKDLSDYYLRHLDQINYSNAIFLQYYYLTKMAKEYDIKPDIIVDEKQFKYRPKVNAHHSYDSNGHSLITKITFNPDYIKRSIDDNCIFDLINTGFHELEHDVQHKMAYDEELTNPQALLWAKEFLIQAESNDNYYKRNYWEEFCERDARDVAFERIKGILKGTRILVRMSSYKCENAKYDLNIKHKNTKGEDILAIDLLDSETTSIINQNPKLLDEYPVLKNIYNSNGEKKTFIQIKTEIYKKMNDEIKDNPKMDIQIRAKYFKLLNGIIETDNNLKLQKYADDIAIAKRNGNKNEMNEGKANIEKLMKERSFSYMEFTSNYKKRISELSNKAIKPGIDVSDKIKIYKELHETRELLNIMLNYNTVFMEEHKKEIEFTQSIDNIRRLLNTTPSPYNFIASEKEIWAVPKSEDELTEDFEKYSEIIRKKASSKEEAEKSISFLQEYYTKLRNELKNKKKKTE